MILLVPIGCVHLIADLIQQAEEQVPEVTLDIELNSLEDAFIKIAESDIRAEDEASKKVLEEKLNLTQEQIEASMGEYFTYEGRQSSCQMIGAVASHKLFAFLRSRLGMTALFMPLIFTSMQLFIVWSVVRLLLDSDSEVFLMVRRLVLSGYLCFFLTLGSTFTAGAYGDLPLKER